MADNFQITQGSGTTIAATDTGGGVLEQKIRVTTAPSTLAQDATLTGGNVKSQLVDGSGHTLNIDPSGTAHINVITSALPSGAATDTTITNGNQKTQLTDSTGDIANISAAGGLNVDITGIGANALGQELMAASIPVVIASNQSSLPILQQTAPLAVTAVGVAAAAVTLTIPAVASNFHYITLIEIEAYTTTARTGSATPITVTTTNLPGSIAWTFATGAAIGTTDTKLYTPTAPLKSLVVNTATTIVCPATTSVIWRVNMFYYTGV